MLAHRALYSVTAKPPETASGRSIAIMQVMNKWEPLMLHRIVHYRPVQSGSNIVYEHSYSRRGVESFYNRGPAKYPE